LQEECFMSFKELARNVVRSLVICAAVPSILGAQEKVDHSLFTKVLRDHVLDGGVNYQAIKADRDFGKYLASLSATHPARIKDDTDRLVFWINTYNAFTIKLINDHYPVKSIRDIRKNGVGPWDIVWIPIGGKQHSLNQIEHEIIRKEFHEPRIHMALVCAAVSCPPLRSEAYDAKKLESQLDDNARRFLFDPSKNRYEKKTKTLFLSELFNWYGKDFETRYGSAERFVLTVLGLTNEKPAAIRYVPYDWSLNVQ
jgi:hypothetical protein